MMLGGGAALWLSAGTVALTACLAYTLSHVVAGRTGLLDWPDGVRKVHTKPTPLVGGIAVLVPSFLFTILAGYTLGERPFIVTAVFASTIAMIVGLIDDLYGVRPLARLLPLVLISIGALLVEPLFVLHALRFHVIGMHIIVPLGVFAFPFTVLALLGFLNAANLADGMNGQWLGSVIIWALLISLHLGDAYIPYMIVTCAAAVTFIFNMRGLLFAGSAGTYGVSLFIALGAIAAYRISEGALPAEVPALWFWLPVLDCLRVSAMRILQGRSPFAGDRSHFHHILMDLLPRRLVLAAYLLLLAAPGVLWEFSGGWAKTAFFVCISLYTGAVVVWYGLQSAKLRTAFGLPESPKTL